MQNFILSLFTLFFISSPDFSQKSRDAIFVAELPSVDGLDVENTREKAFVVDEFYQREPNLGQPVSEKTQLFIFFDKNHIYFAGKCWDNPDGITAKEMARDVSLGKDDRIQIILGTYLDGLNG